MAESASHASSPQTQFLYDLATSPEFLAAWKFVTEQPCCYADFEKLPLPDTFDPKALWNLFGALRRCSGFIAAAKPWIEADLDVSWYGFPKSTADDLMKIMTSASNNSKLSSFVATHAGGSLDLTKMLASEVASLASRDGISISPKRVAALWIGADTPRDNSEKAVEQAYRIFNDTERFRNRRLSPTLVEDLHELLTIESGELEDCTPTSLQPDLYQWDKLADAEFTGDMLERVLEQARTDEVEKGPVAIALDLTFNLWMLRVFPSLNHLTEWLVRRVFFQKTELDALTYVPFSALLEQVGKPYLDAFRDNCLSLSREPQSAVGLDCTLFFAAGIKTYLQGVADLTELMDQSQDRENHLLDQLYADKGMNQRQRDIVLWAARDPSTMLTIGDCIARYNVSHSTARTDLVDLVDKGYLAICEEKRGRELAFRLQPELLKEFY